MKRGSACWTSSGSYTSTSRASAITARSELRGGLSFGRHLQAWRGWHRAGQPGKVYGLENVHFGMSVQEGLLQLGDRQVREVHPVLSPARNRAGASVHAFLRGARPLPRGVAV